MDTAIATFQVDEEAAFTPTLGEVKPIDIFSLERRETKEDTVAYLVEDLARDRRFLHPIAVRDEGEGRYLLISGHQRLEAWKRHFGEQQPIQAVIFPSHMPDARVTLLDDGEDLHRKDLTPAERRAGLLRYAAASRELDGEKLATELPVLGSDAKSASRGGRGKKAATSKLAGKLGLTKAAVQKQIKAASDAIGEPINLDHDTPEELERKAAKLERKAAERQHAEPKVVHLKRRKTESRGVVEDSTQPAGLRAADIGSKIEDLWKALDAIGRFDAIARKEQHRLIHNFCLGLGLGPPKMARPAAFGLVEEEPELAVDLPAEVAPTTDDAPGAHAEQQDDAADVGTENLQDADEDVPEAADQEPNGAKLDAEHLQDAGVGSSEAANQEPGGATKCAYCTMEFYSSDERVMIHGRLYHADLCAKFAKPPTAIAA